MMRPSTSGTLAVPLDPPTDQSPGDGASHRGVFHPEELRPESLLGLLRSGDEPLGAVLDRLLGATGAAWAVVLRAMAPRDSSPDEHPLDPGVDFDIFGRGRGRRPIVAPRRLVCAETLRTLVATGQPFVSALDQPGLSTWRAGAPILSRSRALARPRTLVGAVVIGGPCRGLRTAFRESSADLSRVLAGIAPWVGVALVLADARPAATADAGGSLDRSDAARPEELGHLPPSSPFHPDFPEIITVNRKMEKVLETVRRVATSDAAVLIEGESGTGKELIARAIHQKSLRRAAPFLSENCAACPPNLLEAEFFGVEKGAFTGATATKAGIFERVGGGTLFFDEIGEMDLQLQSKLLRVLQEREVRRVGGQKVIPVDFRLVSATNRSLERQVRQGRFRLDLLYRLEVVKIDMPTLRERAEDIPCLADHFLRVHAGRLGRPVPTVHPSAFRLMMRYHWPGNIRELQNEMWRAIAFGHRVIWPAHLSKKIRRLEAEPPATPRETIDFEEFERDVLGSILRAALRSTGGNCTRAAKLLGMPRTSFYRRARRYGVSLQESLDGAEQPVEKCLARYRFVDSILGPQKTR